VYRGVPANVGGAMGGLSPSERRVEQREALLSVAREQAQGASPRSRGRSAEVPIEARASGTTGMPRSAGGGPPAKQGEHGEANGEGL
jgi:hypothetical protein